MKALRPPMGWNSWDSYMTTITEEDVLANARFMSDNLKQFGWDTIVVDASWFDPQAKSEAYNDAAQGATFCLDKYGRLLPDPVRFPSAADGSGFTHIAEKVHELGLKFGFHVMRGIPRQAVRENCPVEGTQWTARDVADMDPEHACHWNNDNYGLNQAHPGAQAWYNAQLDLYASWGIDFLKVDDMQAPFYPAEIEAYSQAIRIAERKYHREISLSLSPGTQVATTNIDFLRRNAQMWRISDDLWDRWRDVYNQFSRMARWAPLQTPGHWADADMLPLGHLTVNDKDGGHMSNLTPAEQRTLLTLWAMSHSPLMMGGDLPTSPAETIDLLKNPWLLEVEARSSHNREVLREIYDQENKFNKWDGASVPEGEFIVWAADATGAAPSSCSCEKGEKCSCGSGEACSCGSAEACSCGENSALTTERGSYYAACFWTGPSQCQQRVDIAAIVGLEDYQRGFDLTKWKVTDLWSGTSGEAKLDGRLLSVTMPAHGCVWLRFDPID